MKKFEILEHKADLKIRAFGKTKEELFENAMAGMFEEARYEGNGKETIGRDGYLYTYACSIQKGLGQDMAQNRP